MHKLSTRLNSENVHGGDIFQTALFADFQQSGQIPDKFRFPFDEVNNQRKITHGNNQIQQRNAVEQHQQNRAQNSGRHHKHAVDDVVGGDGVGAEGFAAGGLQPSVEWYGEKAAEKADGRHHEHNRIRLGLR